jgi:CO/xanthine dehydrogenase FAD-binding subunit
MSRFDYVRPTSLAEAIELLNDQTYQNMPLAGGTDLMVYLHHEGPAYSRLVDISTLPDLKKISKERQTITLGAGVTFTRVIENKILQEYTPFLVEACRSVGSPQIRNGGTIGGNVANAAACADSLPVLVCLDTSIHLLGPNDTRREMPVAEFVISPNKTNIEPGELITHFTFSTPPDGSKTAFIKLGRRNAQAISRLTMAVSVHLDSNGLIDYAHLTPGAATPQTRRFTAAENVLIGQEPGMALYEKAGKQVSETMIEVTGRRWSTEYKEPAIQALTIRALQKALDDSIQTP